MGRRTKILVFYAWELEPHVIHDIVERDIFDAGEQGIGYFVQLHSSMILDELQGGRTRSYKLLAVTRAPHAVRVGE